MNRHREVDDGVFQNDYTQLGDTEANKDFMVFSPRNNYQFDPTIAPFYEE